jgi:hypothetical protein
VDYFLIVRSAAPTLDREVARPGDILMSSDAVFETEIGRLPRLVERLSLAGAGIIEADVVGAVRPFAEHSE